MVTNEQARVSLASQIHHAPGCEICMSRTNGPKTALVIRHQASGLIELAACARCVEAVRRLASVTGGHPVFAFRTDPVAVPAIRRTVPSRARPGGAPALIHEFRATIRDPMDRALYVARAYGQARVDSTWEGWLEFVAVGGSIVLRTGQETTQSNRAAVAHWAAGLEPLHLEGAFARARKRAR
jgi:hypothetical protein